MHVTLPVAIEGIRLFHQMGTFLLLLSGTDTPHQQHNVMKAWNFKFEAGCHSAGFHIMPFRVLPGDYITVYGLHENNKIGQQRFTGTGLGDQGEVYSLRIFATELVLELHAVHADSHFVIDYTFSSVNIEILNGKKSRWFRKMTIRWQINFGVRKSTW